MGISKQEWRDIEERSAAAKRGERREAYHTFRKFYAVPVSIAAALGALGYGMWWLKAHAVDPVLNGSSPLPVLFWLGLSAACLLTFAAFRRRIIPLSPFAALIRAVVVGGAWLALAGYAAASLT